MTGFAEVFESKLFNVQCPGAAVDIILSVYTSYFVYCYIMESPCSCSAVQGGSNIIPSVYTSYFVYCWGWLARGHVTTDRSFPPLYLRSAWRGRAVAPGPGMQQSLLSVIWTGGGGAKLLRELHTYG